MSNKRREQLYDAITDIDEKFVAAAEEYQLQNKKNRWLFPTVLAACLCLAVAVIFVLWPHGQLQARSMAQRIEYRGATFYLCGSKGEGEILEQCGLPKKLTAALAGKHLSYLRFDGDHTYYATTDKADAELFEYAPVTNDNVYIVSVDGVYYAAIRNDSSGYHGLSELQTTE